MSEKEATTNYSAPSGYPQAASEHVSAPVPELQSAAQSGDQYRSACMSVLLCVVQLSLRIRIPYQYMPTARKAITSLQDNMVCAGL